MRAPDNGYTGLYRELDGDVPTYECRLWRWGACARIEEPPGRMVLMANRETWWRSWPVDEGVVTIPRTADNWIDFDLSRFAGSEDPLGYWSDACVYDFVGPVVFEVAIVAYPRMGRSLGSIQ